MLRRILKGHAWDLRIAFFLLLFAIGCKTEPAHDKTQLDPDLYDIARRSDQVTRDHSSVVQYVTQLRSLSVTEDVSVADKLAIDQILALSQETDRRYMNAYKRLRNSGFSISLVTPVFCTGEVPALWGLPVTIDFLQNHEPQQASINLKMLTDNISGENRDYAAALETLEDVKIKALDKRQSVFVSQEIGNLEHAKQHLTRAANLIDIANYFGAWNEIAVAGLIIGRCQWEGVMLKVAKPEEKQAIIDGL